jgi:hypothetical protein
MYPLSDAINCQANKDGEDHGDRQLTLEDIRQILDLPESAFLEVENNVLGERIQAGSICSSSHSSTETSSEMELDADSPGSTDFGHQEFDSPALWFPDPCTVGNATLIQEEAMVEGFCNAKNMRYRFGVTNWENEDMAKIPQDIQIVINPQYIDIGTISDFNTMSDISGSNKMKSSNALNGQKRGKVKCINKIKEEIWMCLVWGHQQFGCYQNCQRLQFYGLFWGQ